MNGKVKIGVFGAMRGLSLLEPILRNPAAELVAVCERYQPSAEKCRKAMQDAGLKVAFYKEFDQFMSHDMDAVVLANYAHEHAPYAIRLLNSGRHVLSEVLPVKHMAEAVALTEAVEQSGKIYAYAENYCFFPATYEMRKRYHAGDIGEFRHGEGEYMHNRGPLWPRTTRGEKNHWRNHMSSTYYSTHSIGPILNITDTRPVRVVGFETPPAKHMAELGCLSGGASVIMLQMDNGAMFKALQGYLKREPPSVWYCLYGENGMMETDRTQKGVSSLSVYAEGKSKLLEDYLPAPPPSYPNGELAPGRFGADYCIIDGFVSKILGCPDDNGILDVYRALDIGLPGILAYRSICEGNMPIKVPDFRNREEREPYRNDEWSTFPEENGAKQAASCSFGEPEIPDGTYEKVRDMLEKGQFKF